jgi:pyruvate formate lyase activating enzyme
MGGPEIAARGLHPAPPESYTIFTAGCNFKCLNCQNWTISQYPDNNAPVEGYLDPAVLAEESVQNLLSSAGRRMGADRIFFSGGEPTIHLPYIERVVEEARKILPGCKVNFDTNGFMTEESLGRVLAFASSVTFDLKACFDDTHRAITGAPVAPVLRNAEIVARTAPDKLWEFRIVVIPQVNEEDIPPLCRFVARISADLPVCFLAFRPNFVLADHPGASAELMTRCLAQARDAGLNSVSWAGQTGIPGIVGPVDEKTAGAYQKVGAALAAAYAATRGCRTHPRDCGACVAQSRCAVKRYGPGRSC